MNRKPIVKNLGGHRLVMPDPCPEDRAKMLPLPGDNRYCQRCNKVVHDLRGKSEAEILALFEAHGGKLCGTIQVRRFVPKAHIQLAPIAIRKPSYLRHLAASASLLLLAQGMMAAPAFSSEHVAWTLPQSADRAEQANAATESTDPNWSQNTLVSCIFIYEDSSEIDLDLKVSIFSGGVLITQAVANHGLLKIDLAGKVKPDAMIGIVVAQNSAFNPDDPEQEYKHKGIQKVVRLRDAQNVKIKVDFEVMWTEDVITYGGAPGLEVIEAPEIPEPPVIGEIEIVQILPVAQIADQKDGPKLQHPRHKVKQP